MIGFPDTFFAGFDLTILRWFHKLAECGGIVFTPFFSILSMLGKWGLAMILCGGILCLFSKTRKCGFSILLSLTLCALFTNCLAKPLIGRLRPYLRYEEIAVYWQAVGSPMQSDASFPSGHTAAASAFAVAVFLAQGKRWLWFAFVFPLLMGCSRLYLMVHYPTDILGGFLFGVLAALLAAWLVRKLWDQDSNSFAWRRKNS